MREGCVANQAAAPGVMMSSVAELPVHIGRALSDAMGKEEQVLLVTRPLPRHAWGDYEVSVAESVPARAFAGVVRIGLAGPIALRLLLLFLGIPVLILQDSGFTLGAVFLILVAEVIVGAMAVMVTYVAAAPLLWMWLAAHMTFVATDRALYAIRDRGDRAVPRRFPLPAADEISVHRLRSNGVGDVVVTSAGVYLPPGDGSDGEFAEYDIGLLSIPDAARVAEVLRAAVQPPGTVSLRAL